MLHKMEDSLHALDALMRHDLAAYTKPQLRTLLARASSVAGRVKAEIDARPCAFPARLAPLVTQWLPLEDVGAALSCAKQWRATSEWAFQLVAAREGVAGEAGIPWKDVLILNRPPAWTGELVGRRNRGVLATITALAQRSSRVSFRDECMDRYFVGRGRPLGLKCRRAWRFDLSRDMDKVDAVGFAITDPAQREVLLEYHVNSNGAGYDEYSNAVWSRELLLDDDDDIWDHEDATLELCLEFTGSAVEVELSFRKHERAIVGGAIPIATGLFAQQVADFARRCEQYRDGGWTLADLHVAPFVRIYDGSEVVLHGCCPRPHTLPPRFPLRTM